MKKVILICFLSLVTISCANPSIRNVRNELISKVAVKSIYVFRLSDKLPNKIIQGGTVRSEGTDIGNGTNVSASDDAIKLAKSKGAGISVFGKVTNHFTAGSLNGFSTIRAFDTETGELVASFHEPSGLLVAYSEHQCVMAAVEETADEFIDAIKKVTAKPKQNIA